MSRRLADLIEEISTSAYRSRPSSKAVGNAQNSVDADPEKLLACRPPVPSSGRSQTFTTSARMAPACTRQHPWPLAEAPRNARDATQALWPQDVVLHSPEADVSGSSSFGRKSRPGVRWRGGPGASLVVVDVKGSVRASRPAWARPQPISHALDSSGFLAILASAGLTGPGA